MPLMRYTLVSATTETGLGAGLGFLDRLLDEPSSDALRPAESAAAFEAFVLDAGAELGSLSLPSAIDLMLGFYLSVRAVGCPIDDDCDMLLFQWGTFDWGDGPSFQVEITRQFISEGDDGISQLSLAFHFVPTTARTALDSGSRWCESLQQLGEFDDFIRASAPYVVLKDEPPDSMALEWSEV